MSDGPINPDREQQRADNIASRRQSGLEPMPKDREEQAGDVEARSGGDRGAKGGADVEGGQDEGDEGDEGRSRK